MKKVTLNKMKSDALINAEDCKESKGTATISQQEVEVYTRDELKEIFFKECMEKEEVWYQGKNEKGEPLFIRMKDINHK